MPRSKLDWLACIRQFHLLFIERFQIGVFLADNELIAVYNLARKLLPHRLLVDRDQQHYVCCENSL